jgi:multidrug efflux pump subunit AcrB
MRRLVAIAAVVACHATHPAAPLTSITVHASLPGASATTLAASVATPLERQLGQIAKLAQMTSRSVRGETTISLGFADTPLDAAALEVSRAITAASPLLPAMPSAPTYTKTGDDAPVRRVAVSSETLPLVDVATLADSIVAQKVEIDLQALAGFGKTIEDVLEDVAKPGSAASPELAPSQFLRDVASTSRGDRSTCAAFAEGKRVVIVAVVAQPGADRVATRLDAQLQAIRQALPQGIDVRTLPDDLTDDDEVVTPEAAAWPKRYEIAGQLAELATVVELGVDRRGELAPATIAIHATPSARAAIASAVQQLPDVVLHTPDAIEIGLVGPDQTALHDALGTLVTALRAANVPVQRTIGDDEVGELVPKIDRDAMARLGISDDRAVDHALAILQPEGIVTQTAMIPIVVTAREPSLDRIYVNSIPLSAFVVLETRRELAIVLHHGQFPYVAAVVGGSREAIDAALATIKVPTGIVRTVQP